MTYYSDPFDAWENGEIGPHAALRYVLEERRGLQEEMAHIIAAYADYTKQDDALKAKASRVIMHTMETHEIDGDRFVYVSPGSTYTCDTKVVFEAIESLEDIAKLGEPVEPSVLTDIALLLRTSIGISQRKAHARWERRKIND